MSALDKSKIYSLCKADTMVRGTGGYLYHGFLNDAREGSGKAICGTKPGKHGYWSSYLGTDVTCPKCLKIISKLIK